MAKADTADVLKRMRSPVLNPARAGRVARRAKTRMVEALMKAALGCRRALREDN